MRFLSPHWLYLILSLPLIYGIFLWDERLRRANFEKFAAKMIWGAIAAEYDPGARMRKATLWLFSLFFVILALARPQWGTSEETTKMTGLDVMVLLDVSNSMETEDVVPSRLKKAKHLIRALADKLRGDRLGLVTFAGGANVVTPLTTDTEYFLDVLSIQSPKMMPTQGTDIGLGIDTAIRAMRRGAESVGPQEGTAQPSRALILVTDGEDHEGQAVEAAAKLKTDGTRLYVFGIGTEKGGPVPNRDESGNLQGYKRDKSNQPVVSSYRPDDLVQIAAAAGGRYWNVTSDETEVDELLKDAGALSRGEFSEHTYLVYQERFQYPLLIAVLLFLLEMSLSARTGRSISQGSSLGVVVLFFGLLFGGFGPARAVAAEPTGGLDTYLENKKGVQAYQQGKIEEAQKHFGSAQALNPDLPELEYNQGLVHMQQGDAESAARDFKQSAKKALKAGNESLAGQSFFNLGAALSKKGDAKGAVDSYIAAINSAQKLNDKKFEQDARKNLELLIQEQQKQKQQDQNKDQKQDQNKDQNKDQKNGEDKKQDPKDKQGDQDQQKQDQGKGDPKDDQQKQEQQNKQYQNSDSRKKKFESKKLSAEDAERVMAELKNRERDLQMRMKKQDGKYNAQTQDW